MNSNQKLLVGLFIVMLVPVLSMMIMSYGDFMRPIVRFVDVKVAIWENTMPLYQVVLVVVGIWSLFLVICLVFLKTFESSVVKQ